MLQSYLTVLITQLQASWDPQHMVKARPQPTPESIGVVRDIPMDKAIQGYLHHPCIQVSILVIARNRQMHIRITTLPHLLIVPAMHHRLLLIHRQGQDRPASHRQLNMDFEWGLLHRNCWRFRFHSNVGTNLPLLVGAKMANTAHHKFQTNSCRHWDMRGRLLSLLAPTAILRSNFSTTTAAAMTNSPQFTITYCKYLDTALLSFLFCRTFGKNSALLPSDLLMRMMSTRLARTRLFGMSSPILLIGIYVWFSRPHH